MNYLVWLVALSLAIQLTYSISMAFFPVARVCISPNIIHSGIIQLMANRESNVFFGPQS